MPSRFEDPNHAVTVGPAGFVEEPFPGRGSAFWAQPPYDTIHHSSPPGGIKPTPGAVISPYGYPFGSGLLSQHWKRLREAGRRGR